MRLVSILLALLTVPVPMLRAQSAADSAAIREAALDYIEGWHTNDAERVERAVHPRLVKRIIMRGSDGVPEPLSEMSAAELIEGARDDDDDGVDESDESHRADVTVLDIYENIASVRIDADEWVDYLHLVRLEGRWQIVNVLWELRPDRGDAGRGGSDAAG